MLSDEDFNLSLWHRDGGHSDMITVISHCSHSRLVSQSLEARPTVPYCSYICMIRATSLFCHPAPAARTANCISGNWSKLRPWQVRSKDIQLLCCAWRSLKKPWYLGVERAVLEWPGDSGVSPKIPLSDCHGYATA